MALPITDNTDFASGYYKISQSDFSIVDLLFTRDKYEPIYLVNLLGEELATILIDDLIGGVPVAARLVDIFNEFHKQGTKSWDTEIYHSQGIKNMLQGQIYYEHTRLLNRESTNAGFVMQETETSEKLDYGTLERNAEARFNDSAETYRAIQRFICDNPTIYPEFRGIQIDFRFSALL